MQNLDPELVRQAFDSEAVREDRLRLWRLMQDSEPWQVAIRLGRPVEEIEAIFAELRKEFEEG